MNNLEIKNNRDILIDWYINNVVCESACSLNIKIEEIIENINFNNLEKAVSMMLYYNPFPSITGRLCRCPCEDACNRKYLDSYVNIQEIEKYIGDYSLESEIGFNLNLNNNKRVLVIGAGLTGLSAAYYLKIMGFDVNIFEKDDKAWGMLNYIPEFELEKEILEQELNKIINMRIKITYSNFIDINKISENFSRQFDAVLIATGKKYKNEYKKYENEKAQFFNAFDILSMPLDNFKELKIGPKVVILGINEIGLLLARLSVRNKYVENVEMFHKESKGNINVQDKYLKKAREEGIRVNYYSILDKITFNKNDNKKSLYLSKSKHDVRTGELIPVENSQFSIDSDSIVDANYESFSHNYNKELIDNSGNIFIYDEFTIYKNNVLDIIENSRNLSLRIHEYLFNESTFIYNKSESPQINKSVIRQKEKINILPVRTEEKSLTERIKTYDKVSNTYTYEKALEECERCFRCSHKVEITNIENCISCGICVDICPTDCFTHKREFHPYVNKINETYPNYIRNIFGLNKDINHEIKMEFHSVINTNNCIRCLKCVNNCPVEIINVKKINID